METSQHRRTRMARAQWGEIPQRFERERELSGMTADAFSAREGISVASLYRWRARVSGIAGAQPPRPSSSPSPISATAPNNAKPPSAPAEFIDLGGLLGSGSPLTLRLELGAGVVLQLTRG